MSILRIISLSEGLSLPNGEEFVNKIFPNIWAFLVQLLAFIVMSIIVIKFAYKPVHNYLEKRREFIANNLKEAEAKNQEASENVKEAINNLNNSKKEAIQIIQDAKKSAEKEKQAIIEQTNQEIAQKRIQAEEDIKKEQEKAIKSVHDEVVDLAYVTSKEILNREVNQDDDKRLIDQFVDELLEKR